MLQQCSNSKFHQLSLNISNFCKQAVNIPLQQRGIVLDLDSSRANAPLIDYDTYLAELSLESIQESVNADYQQELVSLFRIQFFD
jgi:hypothetical protein